MRARFPLALTSVAFFMVALDNLAGFVDGLQPALGLAAAFSVLGALSALGVRTALGRRRPRPAGGSGPAGDRQPEAAATTGAAR